MSEEQIQLRMAAEQPAGTAPITPSEFRTPEQRTPERTTPDRRVSRGNSGNLPGQNTSLSALAASIQSAVESIPEYHLVPESILREGDMAALPSEDDVATPVSDVAAEASSSQDPGPSQASGPSEAMEQPVDLDDLQLVRNPLDGRLQFLSKSQTKGAPEVLENRQDPYDDDDDMII